MPNWFRILPAFALLAAYLFGMRKHPVRTDVISLPFFAVLLVGGAALAVADPGLALILPVALLWIVLYGGLLLSLRRVEPVPVAETARFQETMAEWIARGFTDQCVFRLRGKSPYVIMAFRRPGSATAIFFVQPDSRDRPIHWALRTVIGDGEGVLITCACHVAMLEGSEVWQIVTEEGAALEMHDDAIAFLAEMGIETDTPVGNGLDDFFVWGRERARRAAYRFPISFLAMFIRPLFHVGPLRARAGAERQLRRFVPD